MKRCELIRGAALLEQLLSRVRPDGVHLGLVAVLDCPHQLGTAVLVLAPSVTCTRRKKQNLVGRMITMSASDMAP